MKTVCICCKDRLDGVVHGAMHHKGAHTFEVYSIEQAKRAARAVASGGAEVDWTPRFDQNPEAASIKDVLGLKTLRFVCVDGIHHPVDKYDVGLERDGTGAWRVLAALALSYGGTVMMVAEEARFAAGRDTVWLGGVKVTSAQL